MDFNEYCKDIGLTMTVVQTHFAKPESKDVNKFVCTLSYGGRSAQFDYSMGSHFSAWRSVHVKHNFGQSENWQIHCRFTLPTVADVVCAVAMDARCGRQYFSEFCDDFALSNDSIKARETYDRCQANGAAFDGLRIPTQQQRTLDDYVQEY